MSYRNEEQALRLRCDTLRDELEALAAQRAEVDAARQDVADQQQQTAQKRAALRRKRATVRVVQIAVGSLGLVLGTLPFTLPPLIEWAQAQPSTPCISLEGRTKDKPACTIAVQGRLDQGSCSATVRCGSEVVYEGQGSCHKQQRLVFTSSGAPRAVLSFVHGRGTVEQAGRLRPLALHQWPRLREQAGGACR